MLTNFLCPLGTSGISADCLRSIEVEDLLDAVPPEWRPTTPGLPAPVGTSGMPSPHQWLVLDGDILREHPSEVWEKWETEGSSIKMVIGMCQDSHFCACSISSLHFFCNCDVFHCRCHSPC